MQRSCCITHFADRDWALEKLRSIVIGDRGSISPHPQATISAAINLGNLGKVRSAIDIYSRRPSLIQCRKGDIRGIGRVREEKVRILVPIVEISTDSIIYGIFEAHAGRCSNNAVCKVRVNPFEVIVIEFFKSVGKFLFALCSSAKVKGVIMGFIDRGNVMVIFTRLSFYTLAPAMSQSLIILKSYRVVSIEVTCKV